MLGRCGRQRKEAKMYRVKRLLVALAGAMVLSALVPALGLSAKPVANDHFGFTSDPYSETWCGAVEGTAVDTVVEHYMQDASGNFIDNVRLTSVFTATASGKSVESWASSTTRTSGPIDNGDGTVSFVTNVTGLVLQFKIPNGPVLKDADGKPLLGAGKLTITDLFDATTGDYITTTLSWHGPLPFLHGVAVCGPPSAYLPSWARQAFPRMGPCRAGPFACCTTRSGR